MVGGGIAHSGRRRLAVTQIEENSQWRRHTLLWKTFLCVCGKRLSNLSANVFLARASSEMQRGIG